MLEVENMAKNEEAGTRMVPFSRELYIERAHKSGVKYIVQPGGSVRDNEVIKCCDKYNIAMLFTGIRLFHH